MAGERFSRAITVAASPESCWETITDVSRLVSWVSILDDAQEVQHLERYTAILMDRIGPFKLRADLGIQLSDVRTGEGLHLVADGEDRQVSSRIRIDVDLRIRPAATGCEVVVDGTYEVSGRVAAMGAGVIKKKAGVILNELFTNIERDLGSVG